VKFVLFAVMLTWLDVAAQLPGDDRRSFVFALMQARSQLELADSNYARTRHLYERRLVSTTELEASRAERERAMLDLLERWAESTASAPRLRVLRALKTRSAQGAPVVRLQVSVGSVEALGSFLDSLPPEVRRRLDSARPAAAYLSVKDEPGAGGTAIGLPYERRIPFDSGVRETEFKLLRDVDALVVALSSGGFTDERKVLLEADVSGAITVQSLPFSQEVDLGAEAQYEVTVERMSADPEPLRLSVHGLPPSITYHFTEMETGARVGQLRFSPDESRRSLRLTLSVPAVEAGGPSPDSAYRFLVLAASRDLEVDESSGASDGARWREMGAGVAELEVVPRGVGRAELRVLNLFHEVVEGRSLAVDVIVRNAGSRALDQVRIATDLPPGWLADANPREILELPPGEEQRVTMTVTPAKTAELGDYEARLRLEGSSGRTKIAVEPTVLRVRVRGQSGGFTTVLLLVALVAVGVATLIFVRRISAR
jgi:hypothetical protein